MKRKKLRKPNCEKCKNKTCLKKGKPCKEVERWFASFGIKGDLWIRPEISTQKRKDGLGRSREVPFSAIKWDVDNDFAHDK